MAIGLLFAGSGSAALACPSAGLPPSSLSIEAAETSVTCLVNKARRHHGVRRLRWNASLQAAAKNHSAAMDSYNFFGHEGDGSPIERARQNGYLAGASTWMVGEDLHWGIAGQGTPKATVRRWLSSPVHRFTMLMPRFRHIGVGVAMGSPVGGQGVNSAIYTADFGLSR